MKILITGGAGFIGSAIAKRLMDRGDRVVLVDNFNDYYDLQLKEDRIRKFLKGYRNKRGEDKKGKFTLYRADIRNAARMERIFAKEKPGKVIHLAAMAGVRASLENPVLYADVNVVGTTVMLDVAAKHKIRNFVYASSSSVYGDCAKVPFSEDERADKPVSPYAATKKATELLAYTYYHLYKMPVTALRYFTVYGPWGRPDMGVFKFPERIINGEVIDVYNRGKMERSFTYIDDIASGTIVALDADLDGANVLNIGNDRTVKLMDFIKAVEKTVGAKAKKRMLNMQPGDVVRTSADISKIRALGWAPTTHIEEGIAVFVDWYRAYYGM